MSEPIEDAGQICLKWWKSLNPLVDKVNGNLINRGDPGALARLRRANSPLDALQEPQAMQLAFRLNITLASPEKLELVGAIASTLAHVKENRPDQKVAKALGPQQKDETGVMSILRFRNLLAAKSAQELMREMRRAIKLLNGQVNITELANAMFYWSDQERTRWTYNYWQKNFSNPEATSTQTVNSDAASSNS